MSRTNSTLPSAQDPRSLRRRDVAYALAAAVTGTAVLVLMFIGGGSSGVEPATSSMIASEVVREGGLLVDGARVDLGTVPLDVTVTPSWTITNTSTGVVRLGEPHASVITGCCPGQLSLSDGLLEPGESSTLTFPLQMHAGMDGPHDFDVHIPYGDAAGFLTLKVVGTFTG